MRTTIDGVELAYDDAGSGDDALVLLHGFPLSRSVWDGQFAALAQVTRVIRVDLRGSGESSAGVGPALMETLAGDVFGLLDARGIGRAVIAGHSMGGYVALAFFRMYAERVAGLALVSSHTGTDAPADAAGRIAMAEAVVRDGMAPLAGTILDRVFAPAFASAQPAIIERVRAMMLRADPAGAAAQIIGMKERVDSADLLEDIAVPSLIIAGGADPLIAPDMLERTAAAIADCEYCLLPDVAHMPMFEAPDATTAALERLLARCATAPDPTSPRNARATRV